MKRLLAATALFLVAAAAPAAAAPDISGYWMIPYTDIPPNREATAFEQSLIDELDPDTVLLADSGLEEFPVGEYGGLKVFPELAEAAEAAYDPEDQRTVSNTCRPPSVVYGFQGPFPIEIFQGRDIIVIKMEYFDVVRVILMNETEHPEDWPLSVAGHSIGWWEGDDLIVSTKFLSPTTIFNNGLDHSENMHMMERFRLSPDGQVLGVMQVYEDGDVFEGKGARLIPMDRLDGHVYPYDCDPSYGLAVENRERN